MALELLASTTHAVANARGLAAELGIIQQLFNVAHPVGPLPEALAGDRSARPARRTFEQLVKPRRLIRAPTLPLPAACGATALVLILALASLAALRLAIGTLLVLSLLALTLLPLAWLILLAAASQSLALTSLPPLLL